MDGRWLALLLNIIGLPCTRTPGIQFAQLKLSTLNPKIGWCWDCGLSQLVSPVMSYSNLKDKHLVKVFSRNSRPESWGQKPSWGACCRAVLVLNGSPTASDGRLWDLPSEFLRCHNIGLEPGVLDIYTQNRPTWWRFTQRPTGLLKVLPAGPASEPVYNYLSLKPNSHLCTPLLNSNTH